MSEHKDNRPLVTVKDLRTGNTLSSRNELTQSIWLSDSKNYIRVKKSNTNNKDKTKYKNNPTVNFDATGASNGDA